MNTTPRIALLLAVGGFAADGNAQNVDTSEWVCEFCPFEAGHSANYEVGASSVSDDSAYLGNATGYDEKGAYANLDGDGTYSGENHRLDWYAEDLGLDSRVLEIDGGKPGTYSYSLDWSELPYRQFITTSTVFSEGAGGSLALPGGWVRAGTTAGLTALNASLVSRSIESDRQTLGLAGRWLASERISVSADYRRRQHDGEKTYGASSFTNSALAPMPFDYVTDEVELGVRYGYSNGFVSLGWYLSEFENNFASLTWEHPFTTAGGAETMAMAQAPDNRLQQVTVGAGYSFEPGHTVLSLTATIGEIEQTASFLPYTTNPNLVVPALPASNLNGDVDTTNIAFTATARPFNKARIKFGYRYDERDNKTSVELWDRVIADTFYLPAGEPNLPYSYERNKLDISGDYDLFSVLRISAGYERREVDRNLQEVASQTEDTGWGRLRWQALDTLQVDARGGTAKRDIGAYDEALALQLGQNPLMRKYNLAHRYREFGELRFSWSPLAAPVAISLQALHADDDYTKSELGLRRGRQLNIGADFSWAINENSTVYVHAGSDSIESQQFGSESFGPGDWTADNEDEFSTIGAGVNVNDIGGKFDIEFGFLTSDGETRVRLDSAANLPEQFPKLENRYDQLRLELTYRRSESLEIDLALNYQSFESSDWSLAGVAPDTIPVVLSLGAKPYDDESFIVGIGFRYRSRTE